MATNVPMTEENRARCLCARECLTYDASRLTVDVCCATGESKESVQMQGCKCPLCEVGTEYHLKRYIIAELKQPHYDSGGALRPRMGRAKHTLTGTWVERVFSRQLRGTFSWGLYSTSFCICSSAGIDWSHIVSKEAAR